MSSFFLKTRHPPRSTLFPYTTLSRSPVTPPPSKAKGPDDCTWRPPDVPLNLGAQRQHLDVCRFLLDAGADPNATDSWGNSLRACCSAEPADPKVVTLLLQLRPD